MRRIKPENRKKVHTISIEDEIWGDISYIALEYYKFSSIAAFFRTRILEELEKTMPKKYKRNKKNV